MSSVAAPYGASHTPLDLDAINDEERLRTMWQTAEDFGDRRRIRARMYRLREQRLREMMQNDEEALGSLNIADDDNNTNETTETTINVGESGKTSRRSSNIQVTMHVDGDTAITDSISTQNVRLGGLTMRGVDTINVDAEDIIQERIRKASKDRTARYQKIIGDFPDNEGDAIVSITKNTYSIHSNALADGGYISMKNKEVRDSVSPTRIMRERRSSAEDDVSANEGRLTSDDEATLRNESENVIKAIETAAPKSSSSRRTSREESSSRKTSRDERNSTTKSSKTRQSEIPIRKESTRKISERKLSKELDLSSNKRTTGDKSSPTSPSKRSPGENTSRTTTSSRRTGSQKETAASSKTSSKTSSSSNKTSTSTKKDKLAEVEAKMEASITSELDKLNSLLTANVDDDDEVIMEEEEDCVDDSGNTVKMLVQTRRKKDGTECIARRVAQSTKIVNSESEIDEILIGNPDHEVIERDVAEEEDKEGNKIKIITETRQRPDGVVYTTKNILKTSKIFDYDHPEDVAYNEEDELISTNETEETDENGCTIQTVTETRRKSNGVEYTTKKVYKTSKVKSTQLTPSDDDEVIDTKETEEKTEDGSIVRTLIETRRTKNGEEYTHRQVFKSRRMTLSGVDLQKGLPTMQNDDEVLNKEEKEETDDNGMKIRVVTETRRRKDGSTYSFDYVLRSFQGTEEDVKKMPITASSGNIAVSNEDELLNEEVKEEVQEDGATVKTIIERRRAKDGTEYLRHRVMRIPKMPEPVLQVANLEDEVLQEEVNEETLDDGTQLKAVTERRRSSVSGIQYTLRRMSKVYQQPALHPKAIEDEILDENVVEEETDDGTIVKTVIQRYQRPDGSVYTTHNVHKMFSSPAPVTFVGTEDDELIDQTVDEQETEDGCVIKTVTETRRRSDGVQYTVERAEKSSKFGPQVHISFNANQPQKAEEVVQLGSPDDTVISSQEQEYEEEDGTTVKTIIEVRRRVDGTEYSAKTVLRSSPVLVPERETSYVVIRSDGGGEVDESGLFPSLDDELVYTRKREEKDDEGNPITVVIETRQTKAGEKYNITKRVHTTDVVLTAEGEKEIPKKIMKSTLVANLKSSITSPDRKKPANEKPEVTQDGVPYGSVSALKNRFAPVNNKSETTPKASKPDRLNTSSKKKFFEEAAKEAGKIQTTKTFTPKSFVSKKETDHETREKASIEVKLRVGENRASVEDVSANNVTYQSDDLVVDDAEDTSKAVDIQNEEQYEKTNDDLEEYDRPEEPKEESSEGELEELSPAEEEPVEIQPKKIVATKKPSTLSKKPEEKPKRRQDTSPKKTPGSPTRRVPPQKEPVSPRRVPKPNTSPQRVPNSPRRGRSPNRSGVSTPRDVTPSGGRQCCKRHREANAPETVSPTRTQKSPRSTVPANKKPGSPEGKPKMNGDIRRTPGESRVNGDVNKRPDSTSRTRRPLDKTNDNDRSTTRQSRPNQSPRKSPTARSPEKREPTRPLSSRSTDKKTPSKQKSSVNVLSKPAPAVSQPETPMTEDVKSLSENEDDLVIEDVSNEPDLPYHGIHRPSLVREPSEYPEVDENEQDDAFEDAPIEEDEEKEAIKEDIKTKTPKPLESRLSDQSLTSKKPEPKRTLRDKPWFTEKKTPIEKRNSESKFEKRLSESKITTDRRKLFERIASEDKLKKPIEENEPNVNEGKENGVPDRNGTQDAPVKSDKFSGKVEEASSRLFEEMEKSVASQIVTDKTVTTSEVSSRKSLFSSPSEKKKDTPTRKASYEMKESVFSKLSMFEQPKQDSVPSPVKRPALKTALKRDDSYKKFGELKPVKEPVIVPKYFHPLGEDEEVGKEVVDEEVKMSSSKLVMNASSEVSQISKRTEVENTETFEEVDSITPLKKERSVSPFSKESSPVPRSKEGSPAPFSKESSPAPFSKEGSPTRFATGKPVDSGINSKKIKRIERTASNKKLFEDLEVSRETLPEHIKNIDNIFDAVVLENMLEQAQTYEERRLIRGQIRIAKKQSTTTKSSSSTLSSRRFVEVSRPSPASSPKPAPVQETKPVKTEEPKETNLNETSDNTLSRLEDSESSTHDRDDFMPANEPETPLRKASKEEPSRDNDSTLDVKQPSRFGRRTPRDESPEQNEYKAPSRFGRRTPRDDSPERKENKEPSRFGRRTPRDESPERNEYKAPSRFGRRTPRDESPEQKENKEPSRFGRRTPRDEPETPSSRFSRSTPSMEPKKVETPKPKETPKSSRPQPQVSKPASNDPYIEPLRYQKKQGANTPARPATEQSDVDKIVSAYGCGPTDDNGMPVFGLRALRKKKAPVAEVESTPVVEERSTTSQFETSESITTEEKSEQAYEPTDASGQPIFGLRALKKATSSVTATEKAFERSDVEETRETASSSVESSRLVSGIVTQKQTHAIQEPATVEESPRLKPKQRLRENFEVPERQDSRVKTWDLESDLTTRSQDMRNIIAQHETITSEASPKPEKKLTGILKKTSSTNILATDKISSTTTTERNIHDSTSAKAVATSHVNTADDILETLTEDQITKLSEEFDLRAQEDGVIKAEESVEKYDDGYRVTSRIKGEHPDGAKFERKTSYTEIKLQQPNKEERTSDHEQLDSDKKRKTVDQFDKYHSLSSSSKATSSVSSKVAESVIESVIQSVKKTDIESIKSKTTKTRETGSKDKLNVKQKDDNKLSPSSGVSKKIEAKPTNKRPDKKTDQPKKGKGADSTPRSPAVKLGTTQEKQKSKVSPPVPKKPSTKKDTENSQENKKPGVFTDKTGLRKDEEAEKMIANLETHISSFKKEVCKSTTTKQTSTKTTMSSAEFIENSTENISKHRDTTEGINVQKSKAPSSTHQEDKKIVDVNASSNVTKRKSITRETEQKSNIVTEKSVNIHKMDKLDSDLKSIDRKEPPVKDNLGEKPKDECPVRAKYKELEKFGKKIKDHARTEEEKYAITENISESLFSQSVKQTSMSKVTKQTEEYRRTNLTSGISKSVDKKDSIKAELKIRNLVKSSEELESKQVRLIKSRGNSYGELNTEQKYSIKDVEKSDSRKISALNSSEDSVTNKISVNLSNQTDITKKSTAKSDEILVSREISSMSDGDSDSKKKPNKSSKEPIPKQKQPLKSNLEVEPKLTKPIRSDENPESTKKIPENKQKKPLESDLKAKPRQEKLLKSVLQGEPKLKSDLQAEPKQKQPLKSNDPDPKEKSSVRPSERKETKQKKPVKSDYPDLRDKSTVRPNEEKETKKKSLKSDKIEPRKPSSERSNEKEEPKKKKPLKSNLKAEPEQKKPLKSDSKAEPDQKKPLKFDLESEPEKKPLKSDLKQEPVQKVPLKSDPEAEPEQKKPLKPDLKAEPEQKKPLNSDLGAEPEQKKPLKSDFEGECEQKKPLKSDLEAEPKQKKLLKSNVEAEPVQKKPVKSDLEGEPEQKKPLKSYLEAEPQKKKPLKSDLEAEPEQQKPLISDLKADPEQKPLKFDLEAEPEQKKPLKSDLKAAPEHNNHQISDIKVEPEQKEPLKSYLEAEPEQKKPLKSDVEVEPYNRKPLTSDLEPEPEQKKAMKSDLKAESEQKKPLQSDLGEPEEKKPLKSDEKTEKTNKNHMSKQELRIRKKSPVRASEEPEFKLKQPLKSNEKPETRKKKVMKSNDDVETKEKPQKEGKAEPISKISDPNKRKSEKSKENIEPIEKRTVDSGEEVKLTKIKSQKPVEEPETSATNPVKSCVKEEPEYNPLNSSKEPESKQKSLESKIESDIKGEKPQKVDLKADFKQKEPMKLNETETREKTPASSSVGKEPEIQQTRESDLEVEYNQENLLKLDIQAEPKQLKPLKSNDQVPREMKPDFLKGEEEPKQKQAQKSDKPKPKKKSSVRPSEGKESKLNNPKKSDELEPQNKKSPDRSNENEEPKEKKPLKSDEPEPKEKSSVKPTMGEESKQKKHMKPDELEKMNKKSPDRSNEDEEPKQKKLLKSDEPEPKEKSSVKPSMGEESKQKKPMKSDELEPMNKKSPYRSNEDEEPKEKKPLKSDEPEPKEKSSVKPSMGEESKQKKLMKSDELEQMNKKSPYRSIEDEEPKEKKPLKSDEPEPKEKSSVKPSMGEESKQKKPLKSEELESKKKSPVKSNKEEEERPSKPFKSDLEGEPKPESLLKSDLKEETNREKLLKLDEVETRDKISVRPSEEEKPKEVKPLKSDKAEPRKKSPARSKDDKKPKQKKPLNSNSEAELKLKESLKSDLKSEPEEKKAPKSNELEPREKSSSRPREKKDPKLHMLQKSDKLEPSKKSPVKSNDEVEPRQKNTWKSNEPVPREKSPVRPGEEKEIKQKQPLESDKIEPRKESPVRSNEDEPRPKKPLNSDFEVEPKLKKPIKSELKAGIKQKKSLKSNETESREKSPVRPCEENEPNLDNPVKADKLDPRKTIPVMCNEEEEHSRRKHQESDKPKPRKTSPVRSDEITVPTQKPLKSDLEADPNQKKPLKSDEPELSHVMPIKEEELKLQNPLKSEKSEPKKKSLVSTNKEEGHCQEKPLKSQESEPKEEGPAWPGEEKEPNQEKEPRQKKSLKSDLEPKEKKPLKSDEPEHKEKGYPISSDEDVPKQQKPLKLDESEPKSSVRSYKEEESRQKQPLKSDSETETKLTKPFKSDLEAKSKQKKPLKAEEPEPRKKSPVRPRKEKEPNKEKFMKSDKTEPRKKSPSKPNETEELEQKMPLKSDKSKPRKKSPGRYNEKDATKPKQPFKSNLIVEPANQNLLKTDLEEPLQKQPKKSSEAPETRKKSPVRYGEEVDLEQKHFKPNLESKYTQEKPMKLDKVEPRQKSPVKPTEESDPVQKPLKSGKSENRKKSPVRSNEEEKTSQKNPLKLDKSEPRKKSPGRCNEKEEPRQKKPLKSDSEIYKSEVEKTSFLKTSDKTESRRRSPLRSRDNSEPRKRSPVGSANELEAQKQSIGRLVGETHSCRRCTRRHDDSINEKQKNQNDHQSDPDHTTTEFIKTNSESKYLERLDKISSSKEDKTNTCKTSSNEEKMSTSNTNKKIILRQEALQELEPNQISDSNNDTKNMSCYSIKLDKERKVSKETDMTQTNIETVCSSTSEFVLDSKTEAYSSSSTISKSTQMAHSLTSDKIDLKSSTETGEVYYISEEYSSNSSSEESSSEAELSDDSKQRDILSKKSKKLKKKSIKVSRNKQTRKHGKNEDKKQKGSDKLIEKEENSSVKENETSTHERIDKIDDEKMSKAKRSARHCSKSVKTDIENEKRSKPSSVSKSTENLQEIKESSEKRDTELVSAKRKLFVNTEDKGIKSNKVVPGQSTYSQINIESISKDRETHEMISTCESMERIEQTKKTINDEMKISSDLCHKSGETLKNSEKKEVLDVNESKLDQAKKPTVHQTQGDELEHKIPEKQTAVSLEEAEHHSDVKYGSGDYVHRPSQIPVPINQTYEKQIAKTQEHVDQDSYRKINEPKSREGSLYPPKTVSEHVKEIEDALKSSEEPKKTTETPTRKLSKTGNEANISECDKEDVINVEGSTEIQKDTEMESKETKEILAQGFTLPVIGDEPKPVNRSEIHDDNDHTLERNDFPSNLKGEIPVMTINEEETVNVADSVDSKVEENPPFTMKETLEIPEIIPTENDEISNSTEHLNVANKMKISKSDKKKSSPIKKEKRSIPKEEKLDEKIQEPEQEIVNQTKTGKKIKTKGDSKSREPSKAPKSFNSNVGKKPDKGDQGKTHSSEVASKKEKQSLHTVKSRASKDDLMSVEKHYEKEKSVKKKSRDDQKSVMSVSKEERSEKKKPNTSKTPLRKSSKPNELESKPGNQRDNDHTYDIITERESSPFSIKSTSPEPEERRKNSMRRVSKHRKSSLDYEYHVQKDTDERVESRTTSMQSLSGISTTSSVPSYMRPRGESCSCRRHTPERDIQEVEESLLNAYKYTKCTKKTSKPPVTYSYAYTVSPDGGGGGGGGSYSIYFGPKDKNLPKESHPTSNFSRQSPVRSESNVNDPSSHLSNPASLSHPSLEDISQKMHPLRQNIKHEDAAENLHAEKDPYNKEHPDVLSRINVEPSKHISSHSPRKDMHYDDDKRHFSYASTSTSDHHQRDSKVHHADSDTKTMHAHSYSDDPTNVSSKFHKDIFDQKSEFQVYSHETESNLEVANTYLEGTAFNLSGSQPIQKHFRSDLEEECYRKDCSLEHHSQNIEDKSNTCVRHSTTDHATNVDKRIFHDTAHPNMTVEQTYSTQTNNTEAKSRSLHSDSTNVECSLTENEGQYDVFYNRTKTASETKPATSITRGDYMVHKRDGFGNIEVGSGLLVTDRTDTFLDGRCMDDPPAGYVRHEQDGDGSLRVIAGRESYPTSSSSWEKQQREESKSDHRSRVVTSSSSATVENTSGASFNNRESSSSTSRYITSESEDTGVNMREGRSFLDDRSKVTGFGDVLSRMGASEAVDHESKVTSDDQARSLLNKFLGAQVLMTGVESMMASSSVSESSKMVSGSDGTTTVTQQKSGHNTNAASKDGALTHHSTKSFNTGPQTTTLKSSTVANKVAGEKVIVKGVNINEVTDDFQLNQLLDSCDQYEDRRQIRMRLKSLMAEKKALQDGLSGHDSGRGSRTQGSSAQKFEAMSKTNNNNSSLRSSEGDIKTSSTMSPFGTSRTSTTDTRSSSQVNVQKSSFSSNVSSTTSSSLKTSTVNQADNKSKVSPFDKFKQMDTQTPKKPSIKSNSAGGGPLFQLSSQLSRSASGVKDMLLQWCQCRTRDYKGIKIENFSTSWNDGMAFCALIHHFYPDAFDFEKLDPKNRRYNFDLAFRMADEKAGVYPLLDVEDMVMMKKPDWKCVFTYVQALYKRLKDE